MFVIVMGVTGSGKSTIGKLLADHLGISFYDADDFHSSENRTKMAQNVALDDADRRPWLELLAKLSVKWEAQGGAVLACSALKQAYRALLLAQVPNHYLVYLELTRQGAALRLEARRGHHEFVRDFDHLLDGQFRDLEPPTDAITISAELSPAEILERAAAALSAVSNH